MVSLVIFCPQLEAEEGRKPGSGTKVFSSVSHTGVPVQLLEEEISLCDGEFNSRMNGHIKLFHRPQCEQHWYCMCQYHIQWSHLQSRYQADVVSVGMMELVDDSVNEWRRMNAPVGQVESQVKN